MLHNAKLCNRTLKLTPPAELATSRCAICDHHHSFLDCTIFYDQRLGMSVIPIAFVDIAERLGYKISLVGNRRVINYQAAVASLPPVSNSGTIATATGHSDSKASLDVGNFSALSQDLKNALNLFSQKEQALSEQVGSLQGVVSALSAGQGSLQHQQEVMNGKLAVQAENSLAVLKALTKLRTDFETTREKHEKAIAAGEAQYQSAMDEFKQQMAVVDQGVKGPHGSAMQQ
jgi:hypothetical protein